VPRAFENRKSAFNNSNGFKDPFDRLGRLGGSSPCSRIAATACSARFSWLFGITISSCCPNQKRRRDKVPRMSEAAASSVSKLARAITAIERGEVLEQDVAEFLLRRAR